MLAESNRLKLPKYNRRITLDLRNMFSGSLQFPLIKTCLIIKVKRVVILIKVTILVSQLKKLGK